MAKYFSNFSNDESHNQELYRQQSERNQVKIESTQKQSKTQLKDSMDTNKLKNLNVEKSDPNNIQQNLAKTTPSSPVKAGIVPIEVQSDNKPLFQNFSNSTKV
jgi:hypothetical protein